MKGWQKRGGEVNPSERAREGCMSKNTLEGSEGCPDENTLEGCFGVEGAA